jgi:hypothetical protein
MTKTKLESNCVLYETPDELQTCFSVCHEVVQFSGQASKVVIELRNLMASSTCELFNQWPTRPLGCRNFQWPSRPPSTYNWKVDSAVKPAQARRPSRPLSLHNRVTQSVNNFVGLDDRAVKTRWPSWQLSWYSSTDGSDIEFVEREDRAGPSRSLGMTNLMGELRVWTSQSPRVSKGGELGVHINIKPYIRLHFRNSNTLSLNQSSPSGS